MDAMSGSPRLPDKPKPAYVAKSFRDGSIADRQVEAFSRLDLDLMIRKAISQRNSEPKTSAEEDDPAHK